MESSERPPPRPSPQGGGGIGLGRSHHDGWSGSGTAPPGAARHPPRFRGEGEEESGELPAWTGNAVLIYGARKSGSTLFQNLLDGSPELLAYPAELKLKLLARLGDGPMSKAAYLEESRIPEMARGSLDVQAYLRLWAELPEGTVTGSLAGLMRHDAWFVQRSAVGAPAAPRLWCAKEVGGDPDKVLSLWRRAFPAGKVLFIRRDPLMVTRAVLTDRRRKGRRLALWQIARESTDPLRVQARQSRYFGADWAFTVDYERLVADTSGVMAEVARFLGISYDPAFVYPSRFGKPVVVATASRAEAQVFSAEARWRDDLERREIAVVASAHVLGRLWYGALAGRRAWLRASRTGDRL